MDLLLFLYNFVTEILVRIYRKQIRVYLISRRMKFA